MKQHSIDILNFIATAVTGILVIYLKALYLKHGYNLNFWEMIVIGCSILLLLSLLINKFDKK